MIKEQLLKLRTKIIGTSENEFDEIDLNSKIDKFINWYFQNKVKSHPNYDTNVEYYFTKRMRNFIEKMAVWYELRYPDYEINRLMHCCGQEEINVNDVMFRNNPYVNELLDENSDAKELDWNDFYNIHVTYHVTDHALITWLSCTAHVADHAMIT